MPPEPKDAGPADPLSVVAGGVVQLHELYLALQAGGFSKTEALTLLGQVILGQR